MKNKIISRLFGIFLCLIGVGMSEKYFASEVATNQVSFEVKPILTDTQKEGIASYFNLILFPETSEQLLVELTNKEDKEITIIQTMTNAHTNENGLIDYSPDGTKRDSSLAMSFTDLINGETVKEVVLAPYEEKVVTTTVDIPKEGLKGQLLGGLHFTEKINQEEETQDKQIINRFAYVIAVLLSEQQAIIPDNQLSLTKVSPGQRHFRNYVLSNLQNTAPTMIYDMTVSSTIKNSKGQTIFTSESKGLSMAPNSNFDYGTDLSEKAFEAGNYTIELTVDADDKHYEFKEDFEITKKEAKSYNDKAEYIEVKSKSYWPYIVIAAIALLLIPVIILLKKNSLKR